MMDYKGMSKQELDTIDDIERRRYRMLQDAFTLMVVLAITAAIFIVVMTLILGCDPPPTQSQNRGESVIENFSNAVQAVRAERQR